MKTITTKLLILTIICTILSLLLCFFSLMYHQSGFGLTKKVANQVEESRQEGTPGTGEYLVLAGGAAVIADVATAIMYVTILLVVPSFILFIMLILQLIARLLQIGERQAKKENASRVLSYISMALQITLATLLLFPLISNFSFMVLLAFGLNVASVVIFILELAKANKILAQQTYQQA